MLIINMNVLVHAGVFGKSMNGFLNLPYATVALYHARVRLYPLPTGLHLYCFGLMYAYINAMRLPCSIFPVFTFWLIWSRFWHDETALNYATWFSVNCAAHTRRLLWRQLTLSEEFFSLIRWLQSAFISKMRTRPTTNPNIQLNNINRKVHIIFLSSMLGYR